MLRQMAEKLFAGIAIGVFGAVALFAKVGDQPRLWDVLSDRLGGTSSQQNGPNVIWVDSQRPTTRMLVTADSSFAPQSAVAAGAPAVGAAAAAPARVPAPAKADWKRHLSGMLAMFDITGPATQSSSASVSAAPGAAAGGSAAPAAAYGGSAAVAAVPKSAGVADASAQSYVNYGTSSRSDIMSSASGPVYNFSGKR
jgi:hypothetical protein